MPIDPVEIVVDIIKQYEDELQDLDNELDEIDGRNLTVTLDINDGGDIEDTEAQLQKLADDLDVALEINMRGVRQAALVKEKLEDDMHSTLHIDVDRDNVPDLSDMSLDVGGENGPPDIDASSTDHVLDRSEKATDHGWQGNLSKSTMPEWFAENRDAPIQFERKGAAGTFLNDINDATERASDFESSGGIFPSGIKETEPEFDLETNGFEETEISVNEDSDRRNFVGAPDGTFSDWFSHRDQNTFNIEDPDWAGFEIDVDRPRQMGMFENDGLRNLQSGLRNRDVPDPSFPRGRDWTFNERGDFVRADDEARGFMSRNFKDLRNNWRSDVGKILSNSKGILRSLMPRMGMWMQVIAAAIPLLATLAGAALGAAAALGTLAVAGGAIALGGILAKGDSLKESMQAAQQEAKMLKQELFGIFRPTASRFEPIFDRFMAQIPAETQRLMGPVGSLTRYDGFFINALTGSVDVISELLMLMGQMEPKIRRIANVAGRFFGQRLIALFEGSVNELYKNEQAFLNLIRVVEDVVLAGYSILKMFSFVLAQAEPLTNILLIVAQILSNDLVVSILTAAAAAYSLYTAIGLIGGILAPVIGAIASFISAGVPFAGVITLITLKVWELVTALSALQVAAGILGIIGGLAAGYVTYNKVSSQIPSGTPSASGAGSAGYGTPGTGSGGASGGNTVVIQGDVGRDEYQKMKDEFPGMTREFMSDRDATEKPQGE